MIATAATALGTFLLAGFAFVAWRTAGKTLSVMEEQAQESDARMRESLDQQRRSLEVAALAEYLRCLNELANVQENAPGAIASSTSVSRGADLAGAAARSQANYREYVDGLCRAVERSGMAWRMHHHHHPHTSLFYNAEWTLVLAQDRQLEQRRRGYFDERRSSMNEVSVFAHELMRLFQDWQLKEDRRNEVFAEFEDTYSEFQRNFVMQRVFPVKDQEEALD